MNYGKCGDLSVIWEYSKSMSLIEFQKKFSTEEACQEHLFHMRWPNGYQCPRCAHDQAYFHQNRHLYQCKECGYHVSLTAETIFYKTRIPLVKWFWMIFLMGRQKSGIAMTSLHRMLEIGSYKTVWTMGHNGRLGEDITARTDGWKAYGFLNSGNRKHQPIVVGSGKNAVKVLPWVHIMIANVKGNIRGIFHGVSSKHINRYLSEFCYRLNRKFWEPQLFDRLLSACLNCRTITFSELMA